MYALTLHPDRNLALFRFSGALSVAEFKQAFLDYVADPGFNPGALMVTDGRGVTELIADFSSVFSGVYSVMGKLRLFPRHSRSIILVEDDVQFGMARMLEQVMDQVGPIRIRVIRTEQELTALTGLDLAEMEALQVVPERSSVHSAHSSPK